MKSQSLKWIIGAALFLVLLAGCGNSAPSTNAQGTDNTGSAAHTKNISGGKTAKAGSTSGQVDVTLSPKPTARPKVTPQPPQAKPSVPVPTQPAVVPTAPAVQGAHPMQQTNPQSQSAGNAPAIPVAAQAVFNLINQERAGAGLPPLLWSSQLVQSAHQHNLNMAAAEQLSHQLPGEAYFGDREKQAGVNWVAAAENIGYGSGSDASGTAASLNQSMFAEQPPDDGHRLNILTTSCKMVGVDVVVDSVHDRVWLTEDFAAV